MFQDSDFAGDLEDSKSTLGGILCIFGSRTSVPVSRMCKKQTSVSHSSTESEVLSLDAGLRMELLISVTSWLKYFVQPKTLSNPTMLAWGKPVQDTIQKPRHQLTKERPTSTHPSQGESLSFTYLKTTKPRSKWLSNDHRVALDWFNLEPKIPKNQLADKRTQGSCQHQPESLTAVLTFLQTSTTIEKPQSLICSCLFSGFRVQTVATVRKATEGCGQHTWPDAHTRTFFSLSVSHFTHAQSAWLKMFQGEKSPRHHFALISISFLDVVAKHSSLFFDTSPILTNRLTIQTFSVHNINGRKLQGKTLRACCGISGRVANPAPNTGLGGGEEITASDTSHGNRAFVEFTFIIWDHDFQCQDDATVISRHWPWRFAALRSIQQQQANSSLAEFLQCSEFVQASGNRWQVMCLVDQASRKLWRFRTETLLQQRFLVHSRKGREIDNRCAFVERQSKSSKKFLNGKLTRPSEEKQWLSENCMTLRLRLRREIGKREISTLLLRRSIRGIWRSAISTTPSKSMGRSGSERQDYLALAEFRTSSKKNHARDCQ